MRPPGNRAFPDVELAGIAREAFWFAETDETLWRDSDALLAVGDAGSPELEELLRTARFISSDRRTLLLDYARALRKLDDLAARALPARFGLVTASRQRVAAPVPAGRQAVDRGTNVHPHRTDPSPSYLGRGSQVS